MGTNLLCCAVVVLVCFVSSGEGYSKYGRTCKDIGCLSNEMCVMETDPCSYYSRQNECGSYPTCKKTNSNAARTCSTYVCPPSQVCKMDGGVPKCFNDGSSRDIKYDTQNINSNINNAPSAPNAPPADGNLYPSIPRGETTPRPNFHGASASGGSGYQGGQIGSGYPGQGGSYPQQGGRYPQQSGGGYGQYPQGGYNQGGYQGGYQPYPGYNGYQQPGGQQPGGHQPGGQQPGGQYNPYYNQQYPKSTGNSFTDKLTSSLKSIGTDFLKSYIQKAISGRN